jgi:RNA polymerase sigma-70 factor, ECF subfamily
VDTPSQELTDEQLVRAFQAAPDSPAGREALAALYRRYFEKVARWSLSLATDRDDASDLAQEVFVRVQERLHSFRGESRFGTWLYTVARRVALNRADSRRRRPTQSLDAENFEELAISDPVIERLDASRLRESLQQAMRSDLEPLEAQALWLHFAHGGTVPALSRRFALTNKSGAKALLVSGMRKLRRSFAARSAGSTSDG